MFKRKIISNLLKWKSSKKRKPLILRGARQVGKTSLVNQFATHYQQYIYLNLELDAEFFLTYTSIDLLVEAIFFLHKKDISKMEDTLLFIDEIQEVPSAINLLRYFYEKYPSLHVIAAGSLLETLLNDDTKFPVGRVEFLVLHPFSFTEYLSAMDEDSLIESLNNLEQKPYALDKLYLHFHRYALIGGMPEIINNYVEEKNLLNLSQIYDNLLYAYLNDIPKYAKNNTMDKVLRHCMQQVFFHGGKRISYTNLGNSNYKAREVGDALNTLQRAMILELIYPFTNFNLPMSINFKKRPKCLILDLGLMNHMVQIHDEIIGSSDISQIYAGSLAEQMVGQEIKSNFISPLEKNYFWVNDKNDSDAELDFVIQYENKLIPVEVKSGKIGKLKSLIQFMENSQGPIAVRLYKGPLLAHQVKTSMGHTFILINLPYFLAAYIKEYVAKVITGSIKIEIGNG